MPIRNTFPTGFAVAFLVLLNVVTYANALQNKFVQDDFIVIANNNLIKSLENFPIIFSKKYINLPKNFHPDRATGSGELTYRPLVTASYFIDYYLWALNPLGFHFINILLHILNVLLLFYLAFLLFQNKRLAFFSAALFSVHPINAETVNVINFREDLLAFFFFCSSFVFYVKWRRFCGFKSLYCLLLSLACFALALFSKESSVMLPVILLLYDYFFMEGLDLKACLAKAFPLYGAHILILVLYAVIYSSMMTGLNHYVMPYRGGNFWSNAWICLDVIGTYLRWLFWPVDIHVALTVPGNMPTHGPYFNSSTLFSLAAIVLCLGAAFVSQKRFKALSFSILWFFVTLVPVTNIIPLPTMIASHFLYIPIAGFSFSFSLFLQRISTFQFHIVSRVIFKKSIRIFAAVFLGLCALITIFRNPTWRDNEKLWWECVRIYPHNTMALNNYAQELYNIDQSRARGRLSVT